MKTLSQLLQRARRYFFPTQEESYDDAYNSGYQWVLDEINEGRTYIDVADEVGFHTDSYGWDAFDQGASQALEDIGSLLTRGKLNGFRA